MDIVLIVIGIIIIIVMIVAWGALNPKVETPQYIVRKRLEGGVEIREYGKLIIARAVVKSKSENSAFSIIAGYIFGGNKSGRKIAMTAPVTTSAGSGGMEMFFVMPSGTTLKGLPKPEDSRVELAEIPARTLAVIGFSGYADDDPVKKNELMLLSILKENKMTTRGRQFLMQYNPPWTPPFMRRNEIGIELEGQ
jgi:hypothetical protein